MSEPLGTLHCRFSNPKVVSWKLALNFTVSTYSVRSPSFDFLGSSWCLWLHPYVNNAPSRYSSYSSYYFQVSLERLQYFEPCQEIIYQVTLQNDSLGCFRSVKFPDHNANKCRLYILDSMQLMSSPNSFHGNKFHSIEIVCILLGIREQQCNNEMQITEDIKDIMEGIKDNNSMESQVSDKGISLSQDFRDVLMNGLNYDLILSVSGQQFKAHQDILRARSEVFHAMLSHDTIEKMKGIVHIPDCDPKAFEEFLYYIYTGKIKELNESNMLGLYYIADKYSMPHLKKACREFINMSISVANVCSVIHLASNHDEARLLDRATRYFIVNAAQIIPTAAWHSFIRENPEMVNELILTTTSKLKDWI